MMIDLTGLTIDRYLAELLAERQKLGPFVQILPHCSRLISQGLLDYTLTLHPLVGEKNYCIM